MSVKKPVVKKKAKPVQTKSKASLLYRCVTEKEFNTFVDNTNAAILALENRVHDLENPPAGVPETLAAVTPGGEEGQAVPPDESEPEQTK